MKKIILIGLLATLGLASCKKELKEIGAPASKVEGIVANWELSQAIQIDERSLTRESFNLTNFFLKKGKLPNITFGENTYTVDTAGLSFNFFGGPSGTWAFDDASAPSNITFTPTGGAPITLKLGGPIRPQDNLKISREVAEQCKNDKGPKVTYSFVLTFIRK